MAVRKGLWVLFLWGKGAVNGEGYKAGGGG